MNLLALILTSAGLAAAPAQAVVVPPRLDYSPNRAGGEVAPCGGDVLCVGGSGRFGSIGAAVDAASAGQTIQVAAGRYGERVTIGKRLVLRGGFSNDFGARDVAGTPSVIDAGGNGSVVTLTGAANTVVDGFTITGGRAKLDPDQGARGSGIQINDSAGVTIVGNLIEGNDDGQDFNSCNCAAFGGGIQASGAPGAPITIRNNVVRKNRSLRGGGMAIFVNALIEGNLVEDNKGGSDHGGGLYLSARRMTVRRNLIRGNEIGDQAGYGWGGGGIFFGGSGPVPRARFEGNRWVGNVAPSPGGGLFVDDNSRATLVGDLFHGNSCSEAGGAGLYLDGGGEPAAGSRATLENVTIAGHKCAAGARGAGIFTEGGSSVTITNSIIAGNGGSSQIFICKGCADGEPRTRPSTISFSLLGGKAVKVKLGKGVRKGSPGFGDDFHLAPGSRAIDAGDPRSKPGPEPGGGRRDAGAYGGTTEAA